MTSTIKVDTISENTSANGVAVDGVTLKDGGIAATLASTITTADNTDTLTLISTDADALVGPNLNFYRNSSSPADGDLMGQIKFTGESAGSGIHTYGSIVMENNGVTDGQEQGKIKFNISMPDGALANVFNIDRTEICINEDSEDLDFRVESNGNTHALFVDGGNNHVNIGTATDLGGVLNVAGTQYNLVAGQNDFVIGSSNAGGATLVLDGDSNGDASGGDYSYIKHTTSGTLEIAQDSPSGTNTMLFKTADTHQWTLDASGNWLPAATDHGIYLGVTSATASNLLDDYEEGTWTPVIKSHANTISRASGSEFNTYTKIGRQVTVTFSIQAVTLSGTINNAGDFTRIQGLPFTTSSTAGQRFPSTQLMYFSSGSKFEEENITCNVGTQSNYVEVHEHDGAGTGYSPARIASLTSNTYWFFTMTYFI